MNNATRKLQWLVLLCLIAIPLAAKNKKGLDNTFNAPADKVYDAVYKYVQHHGRVLSADDKHMSVNALLLIPGGKWSYRKEFDCTISVESTEGNRSFINIAGKVKGQASVSDVFGKSSVEKVIEGIREELRQEEQGQSSQQTDSKVKN